MNQSPQFKVGEEVSVVIGAFTQNGISVYIDGKHPALLYKNEVFRKVRKGQKMQAYVKKIREDGRLDVSLQNPRIKDRLNADSVYILERLKQSDEGFLPLNDRSNSEQIKYELKMSKRAFKQAVGILYKARKISLLDHGITLI